MPVTRFGVSLDEDILKALDNYVLENNYPNRSQAIRAIIEKNIVEKKWQCNNLVSGAIVLVYESDKAEITTKITEVQMQYSTEILSVQQFFLTPERKLEIIAVKGVAKKLTELTDKILSIKGVEHGKLAMSKVE
jgi:CopG family transcriptional regulator, nickel-responsive regulator